jgi:aspartyl-tRNA(Asn)/glutamyl-tRNA(Gln) amidotransferase subunit B
LPLAEIVTAPDLKSPEEAKEWLRSLIVLLNYVRAIPRGSSVKADVNINIEGHPRVEVKNINSFKNICFAIDYEVKRQTEVLKKKQEVNPETRGFNEESCETFHMRFKESAEDYRFIPEPDLLPITLSEKTIKEIQHELPRPPAERIYHYTTKHHISERQAKILASELVLATIFEEVVNEVSPQLIANWLTTDFMQLLKEEDIEQFNIDVKELTKILKFLDEKRITEKVTKDMIRKLMWEKINVAEYQKKFGIEKITDKIILEPLCKKIIAENKKVVEDYKCGKNQAFNSLVGKVMAETKGKADYEEVIKFLKKLLK